MFETETVATGVERSADLHLACSTDPRPFNPHTDTTAPGFIRKLPALQSAGEAHDLLGKLQNRPPQCLVCEFNLDQQKFSEMRASVLTAGVVALAVQAGHRAVISARSVDLPIAHWRAEFIFRAVSGIRLLKPELDSGKVLHIVTRAIHFCSSPGDEPEAAQH
ncbi:MAG: hypothetical protein E6R07_08100 [Nevskiaceae bacterium]|nr:MAG: hypothetical protein E6R07_08100 [Nevskiaceae bacterium]